MGIDYHRGHAGRMTYRLVDWDGAGHYTEVADLGGVTGCTVETSILTELGVGGSISYVGDVDMTDRLVRVYYTAAQGDDEEVNALATCFLDASARTFDESGTVGDAELYGVLRVAALRTFGGAVVVPAGTVAVTRAKQLVEACGLPCVAEASSYALAKPRVWTAEECPTYLDVIDDLLDCAGYVRRTDGMGTVVLSAYRSPADKQPSVTFSDEEPDAPGVRWRRASGGDWEPYEHLPESDIPFAPAVEWEWDAFDVPNKVTVICSVADGDPLVASATNDDPTSPYSVQSRGYTVETVEQVSEIASQAALADYAAQRLDSLSSSVESVTVTHMWTPEFALGDVARILYSAVGREWDVAAVSMSVECGPACLTSTRFRRFVR